MSRTPVWLDCDPGHDDAFAILLAAHHPRLNLLGISTIYGNAPLIHTTTNALRILTAIGRPEVPVYAGTSRPFIRDPVHAVDIHGESGLDGTNLLPHAKAKARDPVLEPAVLAMRNALLQQPPGTAWVVATGAWTNVALLFAAFPEVAGHVAGVTFMGGAIGGNFSKASIGKVEDGIWVERVGNTTPWAEFNVFCDPEAARSLLRHPLLQGKLVVIPLDITHLALATTEVQQRLLHGAQPQDPATSPHPLRQMFFDLLTFFAATYENVFGFTNGPPLHDPLAVAVILDMLGLEDLGFEDGEKVGDKGTYWQVDVVTAGEHADTSVKANKEDKNVPRSAQVGQTVLINQATDHAAGVRVPRRINHLDRFWDVIESSLQLAEKASEPFKLWEKR